MPKSLLIISQNSQENTCARVSFLIFRKIHRKTPVPESLLIISQNSQESACARVFFNNFAKFRALKMIQAMIFKIHLIKSNLIYLLNECPSYAWQIFARDFVIMFFKSFIWRCITQIRFTPLVLSGYFKNEKKIS